MWPTDSFIHVRSVATVLMECFKLISRCLSLSYCLLGSSTAFEKTGAIPEVSFQGMAW